METSEIHVVDAEKESIDECCLMVIGEPGNPETFEYCADPVTHTIVLGNADGQTTKIPVCDDCGSPGMI